MPTKSRSPSIFMMEDDGVLFAERANEFVLCGVLKGLRLRRQSESESEKGVCRRDETRSRTSYA